MRKYVHHTFKLHSFIRHSISVIEWWIDSGTWSTLYLQSKAYHLSKIFGVTRIFRDLGSLTLSTTIHTLHENHLSKPKNFAKFVDVLLTGCPPNLRKSSRVVVLSWPSGHRLGLWITRRGWCQSWLWESSHASESRSQVMVHPR